MAKLTSKRQPAELIAGRIGAIVTSPRRGVGIIARRAYTDQRETPKQKDWREKYRQADRVWINATQAERDAWRPRTWKRAWSNYAFYMSYNLQRVRDGLPPTLTPP